MASRRLQPFLMTNRGKNQILTAESPDIVHGDVKCENILIFETDDELQHSHGESRYAASRLRSLTEPKGAGFNLYCKLTDFGVLRHPDGIPNAVLLGGSLPWQAPECSRGHFFEIEEAKRTDVYSFGMLLWRVFLDGDPFKLLGEFEGKTNKEKRQRRNDAVAALKEEDNLVKHVCDSLALSGNFSRVQLEMLCELVSVTLVKDSSRRELDMGRIIRLMTPNNWFEARHPAPPCRMPMHFDAQLLDIEKWHSEFDKASPVVQEFVAFGFREYAEGNFDQSERNYEEKRTAAAYQLAICYANEFGVSFKPDECLKWLVFAAERGSQKAQEALPKLARAFNPQSQNVTVPITNADDSVSLLSSSWASESDFAEGMASLQLGRKDDCIPDISIVSPANDWTYLSAAENCRYDILDKLLSSSVKPTTSKDGVSPLHFLSSWDVHKAEDLGRRLVNAGADINAQAKRGATIGGSPLQWSVYGNHLDHSLVLLKLGADPMAATGDGHDALSFAAKLHLVSHLRLLLENVRPAQVRGNVRRLIEAAAGGESRFTRMLRHEERWTTAAAATLRLIKDWNTLFSDAQEFNELLLPAIQTGLRSDYGRMNSDVQIGFIESNRIDPSKMNGLLRDSILSFDVELFDALLNYGVHPDGLFERGKTLLHLCAKIPDHILAATAFAPRLIDLGAAIDVQDNDGITPWMDAILERKWDLADLLMRKGANPLITNSAGFNVLGLCIIAVNLGSIKYLMKYCAEKDQFHHNSFLVNTKKQISTLQLASSLPLPRAHGMKLEVLGTFLTILANFAREPWQLNFRSNGILPDATALDIAVAKGNVHAVKNLVKKGAHSVSRDRATALALAKKNSEMTTEYLQRKNLERCVFIIENVSTLLQDMFIGSKMLPNKRTLTSMSSSGTTTQSKPGS